MENEKNQRVQGAAELQRARASAGLPRLRAGLLSAPPLARTARLFHAPLHLDVWPRKKEKVVRV